MSVIRGLAWGLASLFIAGTLLHLADLLNVFFQPPNLPDSTNLVDRVLGGITYRHNIWPIFFLANLFDGLGFLAVTGLGFALAARMPASDDRRGLLAACLVAGGVLGAAGQLIVIGSVKTSIDIPYCDCGFKEQEIVSQVWALMVTQGAAEWLVNGAVLLAAIGIAIAGAAFGGRAMSDRWGWLSFGISAVVILVLVIGLVGLSEDLDNGLTLLLTGVLVPAWAIWLGLRFDRGDPAQAGSAV
jgi:hypothetical protein